MQGAGNAWTTFVKEWSKENNVPYLCAISTPAVSAAYKDSKKAKKEEVKNTTFQSLKEQAVALASVGLEPKKPRGRPKKYETEAEAKAAKTAKTIASNKKLYKEKTKDRPKAKRGRKKKTRRIISNDNQDELIADLIRQGQEEDSEDEIDVRPITLGGVEYLIDDNNNLYNPKTEAVEGIYDRQESKISTTNGPTIFLDASRPSGPPVKPKKKGRSIRDDINDDLITQLIAEGKKKK